MKKNNLKISAPKYQAKNNKENAIKSPKKGFSPKCFNQKTTCPDLWKLEEQKFTSEKYFDKLFPNANNKKINFYQLEQNNEIMNTEFNEIIQEIQQNDWIHYNKAGQILSEKYGFQSNKLRKWFEENSNNQVVNKFELQKKYKENVILINKIFEEIDFDNKQEITYWDLYLHKNIYLLQLLISKQ